MVGFLSPGLGLSGDHESASQPSFQPARAGYTLTFPFDHGAHEEYRTEWWYFTGHLFAKDGRRFGYELTFFRRAVDDPRPWRQSSRWAVRQLYFAHVALTDESQGRFRYAEKLSRAGLGKAGAERGQLRVWIDRWSAATVSPDHRRLRLAAQTAQFGLEVWAEPEKPPIVHGERGISRKGAEVGEASHYYSFTRLKTEGTLWVDGNLLQVSGVSWMDHEFGSADLAAGLVGWDWFSVQLESGHEVMAYWLRRQDGTYDPVSSGTLVYPDGRAEHLPRSALALEVVDHWVSRQSGARYPSRWILRLLPHDFRLVLTPRLADQELRTQKSTRITYWEGAVGVEGKIGDDSVRGLGYVELTGYAQPYDPGF